jgi:tetratricopeptide (TPR) repeat protein
LGGPYGYGTPYYGYSRSYYSSPYYYQPRNYYYESYGAVPTYSYDAVPNYYKTTPNVVNSLPNDRETSTAPQPADVSVIAANEQAVEYQLAAERAFREKRYNDAARLASHAVVEDASNGKLYLFQSQALFAIGEFRGAADLIHKALSLLDVPDWGYVVENGDKFYRGRDYVTQMEHLVDQAKQNPSSADLHFLRGYHYLYLGYKDAAQKLLARAMELDDRDVLTRRLLAMTRDELPPPPAPEEIPSLDARAINLSAN